MNARDVVLLTYGDLADGQTAAGQICPACDGDGRGLKTFSVSRKEGGLYWLCHRASCGFRGSSEVRSLDMAESIHQRRTVPVSVRGATGREILRQSETIPEAAQQYLLENYRITKAHTARWGIGYDRESGRLAIPVKDRHGEVLGVNLRTYTNQVPKTLLHVESGAISWHINTRTTSLIIVEDQWSAIRASDYLSSVALLGTHINDERIDEIRAAGFKSIYLALDADAWQKSVGYAIRYRSRCPMQLIQLTTDLKNQTDEELRTILGDLK